jgi:membrane fusion protein, adhesin transport system
MPLESLPEKKALLMKEDSAMPPERMPDRDDAAYMADARAALILDSHPLASAVLYLTAAFFVIALIWAAFANLDEVAVGLGRVIPSSQVQQIQNLEGGILADLQVAEGQVVDKGQVLLRIDDTRFTSSYRESYMKRLSLLAAIARLSAETQGGRPIFPTDVERDAPNFVRSESALFASRRNALETSIASLKRSLDLATQELQMSEPLVARGAISEVEILRLRRQVNDLRAGIEDRRNKFVADANEELTKNRAELSGLTEAVVGMQDRVTRTVVRSPMRGVVKKLNITTLGAVIQPGASILEVVPLEDTLLIEAQMKPDDIGFIHPGLDAMVKITTFDYSIYGGLPGKVELVSADSMIDDKKGVTFYKVLVRTKSAILHHNGKELPIIPGMTAQVDVLTGQKSVLDYLLQPVMKARERALRER